MNKNKFIFITWFCFLIISWLLIILILTKIIPSYFYIVVIIFGLFYVTLNFIIFSNLKSFNDIYYLNLFCESCIYLSGIIGGIIAWSLVYSFLIKFGYFNYFFRDELHILFISKRLIFIGASLEYFNRFKLGIIAQTSWIKFTDNILIIDIIFILIFFILSCININMTPTFINIVLLSCMPDNVKNYVLNFFYKIKIFINRVFPFIHLNLVKNKLINVSEIVWVNEPRELHGDLLIFFIVLIRSMFTTHLIFIIGGCFLSCIITNYNISFIDWFS
jgi:hypothetical protein